MNEIYTRRSARKFSCKLPERDKLLAVVQAGTCAPSALNNMSRQFTVITDKKLIDKLNGAVKAAVGPDEVNAVTERNGGIYSFFYSAPALIVVSTDRNELCPNADCAVALENMFLKAEQLGLSTCWINKLSALCSDHGVRETLTEAGIPLSHDVYGSCAIGYSDINKTPVTSKPNKIIFCE